MTEKAPIQAVLFDLDGTLIDSAPDLAAAADAMRVRRGLPSLPLADYRPVAGAGARGLLAVAFGMTPDHSGYLAMREEFFVEYERCMTQRTVIFDGVPELIAALQARGLAWGVVTNKMARFAEPLTRGMPLFSSAGAVVCGDTTAHAKPHPAPLLEAARRLGLQPQSCWYVGDDARDITAGKAAAMPTVAATYGYMAHASEAASWGADAHIGSPLQLMELLPTFE